jgi:predicted outer membrane protein
MFNRTVVPRTLTIVMALLLAASLGISADSKSEGGDKVAAEDATFIKAAAEGGMAEVQLGKLAGEKGSSKRSRNLASACRRIMAKPTKV